MLKGNLIFQKRALAGCGIAFLLTLLVSLAISYWGENAFLVSFALAAGVAALLVSFLYERFAIYLLIASLWLSEVLKVDFIPSTLLIVPGGLAVIGLLAAITFRKKQLFIHSPVLILALALGVWSSLATFYVGSISESRPYWLVIVFLVLLPNLLTEEEHLLRASWLFLLPLGALGIITFVNKVLLYFNKQNISINWLHGVRIANIDTNVLGLWLTLGIPFTFYLFGYYRGQPVKRFWMLVSGVAMLAGAISVLSIGVTVGLCAMLGLFILFQHGIAARLRSLALVVIALPLVFNGLIVQRLQSQQLLTPSNEWGTYRGEIWAAGFHTMLDYPVFGIGLDPVRRIAMMKYIDLSFVQSWYNTGVLVEPHNIFLSVGMEVGIPGLVLYLLLLAAVLWPLWKLRNQPDNTDNRLVKIFATILLVSLICGVVQGLGLSTHLDKLMWFLMGCVVVLTRIEKSKASIVTN